jgi:hypothetical protein
MLATSALREAVWAVCAYVGLIVMTQAARSVGGQESTVEAQ